MTHLEQLINTFKNIGYTFVVINTDIDDQKYTYVVLCDVGDDESIFEHAPAIMYGHAFFEFNPDGSWASTP